MSSDSEEDEEEADTIDGKLDRTEEELRKITSGMMSKVRTVIIRLLGEARIAGGIFLPITGMDL